MAEYYPPTEDINVFNTALFTNEPDAISQGQASLLYLSKVNSDTSTAPQTNFTGNVSFTVLPQSSAVPSNLPDLVNKSYTDTTFQTIANMVNYLTTSVASATYQTISGMSAYLTTATASATYQTIADMINYVDIASSQTITGLKLFTNNLEVYNATANLTLRVSSGPTQQSTVKQNGSQLQIINNSTTPTIALTISSTTRLTVSPTQFLLDATCFLTTNDIKSRAPTSAHTLLSDITSGTLTISSTTASNTINGATTFSQTASFSVIPNCSITATSASQLVNYTTLTSQGYTTLPIIQANANAWTNTNTFNSFLPTSTISASSGTQLVNYTTLTGQGYTTLALVQANNNAWTGTNSFNSFLPTSTISASSGTQLVNYTTLTGQGYTTLPLVQSNNNVWTGTNSFNSFLPTSTISASSANQLVNYTTLTGQGYTTLALVQANNNTWTGTNNFTTSIPTTTNQATTTTQLVNFTCLNAQSFVKPSFNNAWTGTNSFNTNIPTTSITALATNDIVNFTCLNAQSFVKPSFNNAWTGTNSFNTSLPTSTLTPNSGTQLITKTFADGAYIDFTTDQTISGIKRFGTIFTQEHSWATSTFTNRVQSYITGDYLVFMPQFSNNQYAFHCKDSVPNLTTPLQINSSTTTISNALSITGLATFSNGAVFNTVLPTTTITASSANELVNYTTLTSQSYTTLALVQSNANTFSAINTFNTTINLNGQLNLKNNFILYDIAANIKYVRIYQSGNDISFTPSGGANTNYYFDALNSGGTNVNILKLTSSDATITGNAIITGTANITGTATLGATNISGTTSITGGTTISGATTLSGATTNISGTTTISGTTNLSGGTTITNGLTISTNTSYTSATINLNSSTATHDTNLFTSITSGTHGYLSSLSNNAVVNMFSSSTSDVNLNINAKVKFRQVKLYNQVKTTSGGTLTFPLEENVVINSSTTATITLPAITANSLGMTFNFIKNNVNAVITFTAQGTNTIIKNGSTTGTTSAILLNTGITSIQLTILEFVSSTYNWVVINSSLPQQISNPAGSIITMSVNSLPTGYLFCNGASVSTTTYADLFAVIAYTYGGSGASFNLPNFNNGSFLRGFGGNSAAIATQQGENIKTHTHSTTFQRYQRGSSTGSRAIGLEGSSGDSPPTIDGVSDTNAAGSPDETRPLNFAVYYCIKY